MSTEFPLMTVTYTLYIGALAMMCFFTKSEADRYAFDLSLVHPEYHLAVVTNV